MHPKAPVLKYVCRHFYEKLAVFVGIHLHTSDPPSKTKTQKKRKKNQKFFRELIQSITIRISGKYRKYHFKL